MLNSFWQSRRDTSGGDTTPKAPLQSNPDRERNPFESSLNSSTSSTHSNNSSYSSSAVGLPFAGRHSRKNSAASARDLASSSGSGGSSTGLGAGNNGSFMHGHGASGIPAGLRTPTLQKSFVLPEVTSSVNATGSQVSGSSTGRTATSALNHPSSSGRNTPTRTAHQHTLSGPYPNPKDQHLPPPGSPKPANKSTPDFKLSQPPDSKGSPAKSSSSSSKGYANADSSSSGPQRTSQDVARPAAAPTGTVISKTLTSEPAELQQNDSARGQNSQKPKASTAATTTTTSTATPASSNRRRENAVSTLKGKLTVKIIEARGLITPEANIRPYVVATFEQNEFVSREAINEHEGDATGQPVSPRTSSHLRTSQNNGTRPMEESNSASSMDTGTTSAYNPIWKHEVAFDVTGDQSPVTVCVYARRLDEEFFLGLVDIKPRLQHGWQLDDWYTLHPRQDEAVSGDVHVRMRFERSEHRRTLRSGDFEFLRMIGKGTFGRVFQVRKKDTKRIYAMKVLSKREIIAKKEVQHTIGERKILQRSSECPFLLGLKFSFQSETELFLVMDFKSGGELFYHLQKEGRFTEDRARFYAAEICLAFEYLHKYNIVYRDLKPENILLDATGHIALADFGLSKPDLPSNALTNTFCGTTEYLAPEVLLDDHGYSQTVDFWSLGVLLFEMCCGWSPFYAEDTQQMYKNICFGKIKFPRGVIGDDGKQFVKGLLNRNPAHRLGAKRDAAELKEHAFFKMIDWDALAARQVTVPFKPYVDSDECVRNFDAEFTDADVQREMPVDNGPYFDDDPSSFWVDEPAAGANGGHGGRGPVPINPSKNRLNGAAPGGLDEEAQDAFRGFSYSGDADLHDLMMSASMTDKDDMRA